MNISLIKKTAVALLLATMITACNKSEDYSNIPTVVKEHKIALKLYGKFTSQQKKQFDKANQYIEKQDTDSAIKTLTPLAEEGQSDSQNALAFIYIKQNKVVEAKQWFEKAAQQNHPEAQNNLGMIYLQGIGVAPDYEKARQYFEQAATQNSILAQNNL
ncbi:MAG: sel1 repeat family protein, partial [Neisseriaceae bacterium]|nr:sel1 repeat family protein [Neisseriaceae bacterium]